MANITAAMVKELREMTGAGMMECKKALVEADGDMDKAVDVLRTRGLAAVAKKAGRATNEGTVMALVSEDATTGAVVELNCETDFVGMNEKFKAYAEKVAKAALAAKPADMDALKAAEIDGETVEAVVTDCIHVMGENTQLARFAVVEAGAVSSYIHMGGKIGVLVSFDVEGVDTASDEFKQYGRDVAMQVAAVAPIAANRDQVDPAVVEHEMSIYKAQAAESGKRRGYPGEDGYRSSGEVLQGAVPHRAGVRQEPRPDHRSVHRRGCQEAWRFHQGCRLQALRFGRITSALQHV